MDFFSSRIGTIEDLVALNSTWAGEHAVALAVAGPHFANPSLGTFLDPLVGHLNPPEVVEVGDAAVADAVLMGEKDDEVTVRGKRHCRE